MKKYIVLDNSWSLCLNSISPEKCELALKPQYVDVISEPYKVVFNDKESFEREFINVRDNLGFIYRVILVERGFTISLNEAIRRLNELQNMIVVY